MRRNTNITTSRCRSLVAAVAVLATTTLSAGTIESFVEPYRSVAISAPEIGVIADVNVVEGDVVTKDQVVAKLD
ncbi:MAG: biotin/lipoyl-binding protein, partial [Pirellulaceae bacterium]